MHRASADATQGATPKSLAVSEGTLLSLWAQVVAAIAVGFLQLCYFCAEVSFEDSPWASISPTVLTSCKWSWPWSRELIRLNVSPSTGCQNYLCTQDHQRLCRTRLPKLSVMISGGFPLHRQLEIRTGFWMFWFHIKWVMILRYLWECAPMLQTSFWTHHTLFIMSSYAALPYWMLPKTHGSGPRALCVMIFRVFIVLYFFLWSERNMTVSLQRTKILLFSFWCSTAWKQHINICLDCITLACLIFKFLCMLITWVSGNNLLNEFWHGIRVEILAVSVMTLNILLPFYTMHLCEVIFTKLTIMKSIYQLIMKNVFVSYSVKYSAKT